jgi:integrase
VLINSRRFKVGEYPELGLLKARMAAERKRATATLHGVAALEDITLAELVTRYLELYSAANHKPKTQIDYRYFLEAYVLPRIGGLRLSEISGRVIISALDEIALKGQIVANRCRAILHGIFQWAYGRQLVTQNPIAGMPGYVREAPRARFLSEDEIRKLWPLLQASGAQIARVAQLVLLTAQRGGSVRGMCWREIDLEDGWWEIPSSGMKSGKAHRVYLAPTARGILQDRSQKSEWVFPARRGAEGHLRLCHAPFRKLVAAAGIAERTTIHDLRRTAATHMSPLPGVDPFTVGRVLAHADPRGVTSVYDRYTFDREVKRALLAWDRRFHQILSGQQDSRLLRFQR